MDDLITLYSAGDNDAYNVQLPDPSAVMQTNNLSKRILWIDDDIDAYSVEYIKWIIRWNAEDANKDVSERKPIKLLFFCYGGDLDVNNALIDTIQLSKTPVIGVNVGQADSAGCFIYLACHKRYTFPNAQFLIHKGSGTFNGTYDVVVSQLLNYQKHINRLGEYILKRTNIPKEKFEEYFDTEWYLSAAEAVEYGVAEKMIQSLDDLSSMVE